MRAARATLALWRHALRRNRASRAELATLVLDDVLRLPLLYEDDRGLSYVLYPGENAGVYFEHGGNYEQAETRFCERVVSAGDVVLDVGANIGLYTLLCGRLVGDSGRVWSFEPEPRNATRLRVNLLLNGLRNVEVVEAAVFRESGTVALNVFAPSFGAWHTLGRLELPDPFRPGELATPVDTVDVPAVTLDGHCAAEGIERVGLLKLDVEGAEVDVLVGARRLLAEGGIRTILFEVSLPQVEGLGHEPADAFRVLGEHGYACHALADHGLPGPRTETAEDRYANYVAFAPGVDPPSR